MPRICLAFSLPLTYLLKIVSDRSIVIVQAAAGDPVHQCVRANVDCSERVGHEQRHQPAGTPTTWGRRLISWCSRFQRATSGGVACR